MIKPFTFTLNAISCDVRRFRKCPQVQSGAWTHNGCISRSTQELHSSSISMAPWRQPLRGSADGADGGGVDRWWPHWTSMVWSDFWGRTWQDNILVWAKIEVPRNPEHGSLSAWKPNPFWGNTSWIKPGIYMNLSDSIHYSLVSISPVDIFVWVWWLSYIGCCMMEKYINVDSNQCDAHLQKNLRQDFFP